MSYRIKPSEDLPVAIRRIASEQVAKARIALYTKDDLQESIHRARKHFKKLRALARLVRDDLGEKEYKKQNIYYRDMAGHLSELRDATSVLQSLQLLKNRFGKHLKPGIFQDLKDYLIQEKEEVYQEQLEQENRIEEVLSTLKNANDYISHLKLSADPQPNLLGSIKRVYKRGYHAYQKSFDEPSIEEMHEWRKRAKYLWHQYQLLTPAWKPVFKGFAKETHRLSNFLGDHRDLELLMQKINSIEAQLPSQPLELIKAVANQHQRTLLEQAQWLGRKIYAEKPGKFKKRIGQYLKNGTGRSSATYNAAGIN